MVIENGIKSPSLRMGRGLAQLHLSPQSGPELMCRIAMRFRSGLSEASPKGTLVCPQCDPEKNLTPKPTHPWHQVHRDEWESKFAAQLTHQWYKDHRHEQEYHFRKRNATILVK